MDLSAQSSARLAHHTLVGLLILLAAVFARLYMFGDAPPGLQHDEIFKAQEGVALIERGDFRLFYPTNQGHEGAFVWLLGLSYALVGKNLLMVKLPALFCGLLTVALTYRVTGEAINRRVAFIAAGLVAVSFWGIFTSRVGLRAVMLPLVTLLVLWGLHRLWTAARSPAYRPSQWPTAALTGLALGFAIYTYTSSFALYAAAAVFVLAALLIKPAVLRRRWRQWVLVGLLGVGLALPMLYIRLNDPEGTNRVSTITRPLNDFLAGQPAELLDNAWKLAGMPFFTGDPEWRYNVAGRPLFGTPIGLLVYVGLLVAVWRVRRQPLYAALLVLATVGLVPSLLTVSAPSFLRSIIALPAVMLFVGLALDLLPWTRLVWAGGLLVILVTATTDWHAYFVLWPPQAAVQAIYRDDLQQLAGYLYREASADTLALVSTPDTTLDPLIYEYYHRPGAPLPSFFDGRTNIALGANALLFISPLSSITPPHADWLTSEQGTTLLEPLLLQNGEKAFDIYHLDPDGGTLQQRIEAVQRQPIYVFNETAFPNGLLVEWAELVEFPVNFGGVVELVGVDLARRAIATEYDGVNIQLYFRPLVDRMEMPLNVFVHMSRADGQIHAQRDLLGMPSLQWDSALIFIQDNFVIAGLTPPRRYMISMGVYNFATGERLSILDRAGNSIGDRLLIDRVRVVPQP
jgi:4-amino-4-deoxy-L-arabinose transferase-like glycosyltransferase